MTPLNLTDLDSTSRLKILVYGHSGVGKTIFATGFPKPLYVADFDGKISSARNFYPAEALSEVSYDNFQPQGEINSDKPFVRFNTELVTLERQAKEGKFPYKTFVLDSITTYTEQMLREIMRQHPGAKRYDQKTPVLQDYGIMNSHFKLYLSRVLQLPCNVVVTAHIQTSKDERTGELHHEPMCTGKLPDLLPVLFEEVYRAYTENKAGETSYLAQTRAGNRYRARTQLKGLPNPVELSYKRLSSFLKGEKR
jgi:hypothetical protein